MSRFEIDHADRTHVPHMEQSAYNQKPKDNGWSELRLFNYDGTHLYQWWGKRKMDSAPGADVHYYAWEDPCDGPFEMLPLDLPENNTCWLRLYEVDGSVGGWRMGDLVTPAGDGREPYWVVGGVMFAARDVARVGARILPPPLPESFDA